NAILPGWPDDGARTYLLARDQGLCRIRLAVEPTVEPAGGPAVEPPAEPGGPDPGRAVPTAAGLLVEVLVRLHILGGMVRRGQHALAHAQWERVCAALCGLISSYAGGPVPALHDFVAAPLPASGAELVATAERSIRLAELAVPDAVSELDGAT